MQESKKNSFKLYCSTCELQTEANVICTYSKSERLSYENDPVDSPHSVTVYSFAICKHCESPFLYEQDYYEIPGEVSAPQGGRMLYPIQEKKLDESVPKTVKKAHQDAVRSYAFGLYEPCVIMCRKCLEAICFELGEKRGNLNKKIKNLSEKNIIDKKLVTWANGLRLIGNDAAHDLNIQITKEDANDSIHFVEALLIYVFSLNLRFEEFQKRRRHR